MGTPVDIVGYGVQGFVQGGGPRQELFFLTRYFAPTQLVQSNNVSSTEFIKLSANPSQGSGGICFGDSGGPDLLGGTNTVLAVNSYVTNGNCSGVTVLEPRGSSGHPELHQQLLTQVSMVTGRTRSLTLRRCCRCPCNRATIGVRTQRPRAHGLAVDHARAENRPPVPLPLSTQTHERGQRVERADADSAAAVEHAGHHEQSIEFAASADPAAAGALS
jgi:hypothetical protein